MDDAQKLESLCREVGRISALEVVDPDIPLPELGVESLNMVEILLICEQLYECNWSMDAIEFDESVTLRKIVQQMMLFKN